MTIARRDDDRMPYCMYCGARIEPTDRRCPSCACAAETPEPRDEAPAQPGHGIHVISRIQILPNMEKKVTSIVARLKEVKEAYHLAGNGGMWVKTDVPDIAGVENFIKDKLAMVNGIKNIEIEKMQADVGWIIEMGTPTN